MKSTILLLIVLVASTLAMPAPNEEHREYSRTKRSFLGGYFYPPYGGYGYGFPSYGFGYPAYGYPYGIGGYGLYKGFGHGFYG